MIAHARLGIALLAVFAASCRPEAARGAASSISAASEPPLRPLLLAAVCARVASCAHPHDAPEWRNPSACVDAWLARAGDPDSPVLPCLASARSCADVGACLHPRRSAASAAFCAGHPGVLTACDGARLFTCAADDVDESTERNCASFGAACAPLEEAGGLSTHACVDRARCPAEVTRAFCDRANVVSCEQGELETTTCPQGAMCQAHFEASGEQTAMCEAPGHKSCEPLGSRRCDGPRVVVCEAHGHYGHEHVVDCAAAGLTCVPTETGAACSGPAPRCHADHPRCEGDALAFCAAGSPVRVPCPALGFARCERDGRGPDATCAGDSVAPGSFSTSTSPEVR